MKLEAEKLIAMLKEIIHAGEQAPNEFRMNSWMGVHNGGDGRLTRHLCKTSCCLMGDLALQKTLEGGHYRKDNLPKDDTLPENLLVDLWCDVETQAVNLSEVLDSLWVDYYWQWASEYYGGEPDENQAAFTRAGFIYGSEACDRMDTAQELSMCSKFFDDGLLDHQHLTEDHNEREVAHDFIRRVIARIESYGQGETK